jgi:hypothetical protein
MASRTYWRDEDGHRPVRTRADAADLHAASIVIAAIRSVATLASSPGVSSVFEFQLSDKRFSTG